MASNTGFGSAAVVTEKESETLFQLNCFSCGKSVLLAKSGKRYCCHCKKEVAGNLTRCPDCESTSLAVVLVPRIKHCC